MSDSSDRRVFAALVALLVFTVAYTLISVLAWTLLPDEWSVEDYGQVSEYIAEQGTTIVELFIPGLLAALTYRLIRGDKTDGTTD